MYEFLNQNQMFIVLVITFLIWSGIVWYLVRLDTKVKRIEQLMKKDK